MATVSIDVPREWIAEFCRRNHIRKLSLFGSVLTDRFRPDSDVDVLVEFEQDHIPSLFEVVRMERELSEVLGRKVDLRTPEDLSRHFREQVVSSALVQYDSR
jgi:predicted nucleotidyltransferase